MDNSIALAFPCVPPCIECRQAGLCNKPMASFEPGETVSKARSHPDPHAGIVVLPCGCWGLPWPLVHHLGDSFDSIYCDGHGWLKVTKVAKKKMKKDADNIYREILQATVKQEPLFLWNTKGP